MDSGNSQNRLVLELRLEASLESAPLIWSTVSQVVASTREMARTADFFSLTNQHGMVSLNDGSLLSWDVTLQPSNSGGNTPHSGPSGPKGEVNPGLIADPNKAHDFSPYEGTLCIFCRHIESHFLHT